MLVIKSNASRGDDNTRMTSILDRYLARPLSNEFANMCLASFVSRYRVITDSTHTEEADLEESKTETGKKYSCFIAWVQLQEGPKRMQSLDIQSFHNPKILRNIILIC